MRRLSESLALRTLERCLLVYLVLYLSSRTLLCPVRSALGAARPLGRCARRAWERAAVGGRGLQTIGPRGEAQFSAAEHDATKRRLVLREFLTPLDLKAGQFVAELKYERPDATHLVLKGSFHGMPTEIHLTPVNERSFLLINHDFHWVSESPSNSCVEAVPIRAEEALCQTPNAPRAKAGPWGACFAPSHQGKQPQMIDNPSKALQQRPDGISQSPQLGAPEQTSAGIHYPEEPPQLREQT